MVLSAGRGAWITLIITSVVFAFGAAMIVSLNKMFMGEVLFDYSIRMTGKFATYIISVIYTIYFLIVSVFLLTSFSDILKFEFLPKTPELVDLLAGLPIFCYMAFNGITVVARLFEIIGVLFLIGILIVHITMFFEGKPEYVLPLFDPHDITRYLASVKDAVIAFLGIEVMTIIPFTNRNKHASKVAFLTLICIGLIYVIVVESNIMMIGMDEVVHYNDPLIKAIELVRFTKNEIFQRIDIQYLTFGFMGVFMGITITITATVEYVCKMFKKADRLIVVICIGIIIFVLSIIALGIKDIQSAFWKTITYAGLVVAFLIPAILFAIAKVKTNAAKIG